MSKTIAAVPPAKLWKLLLVLALAAAVFGLPTPRSAEASPCTAACLADYSDCRELCINNCRTRVPCYADCVDECNLEKQFCLAHC